MDVSRLQIVTFLFAMMATGLVVAALVGAALNEWLEGEEQKARNRHGGRTAQGSPKLGEPDSPGQPFRAR